MGMNVQLDIMSILNIESILLLAVSVMGGTQGDSDDPELIEKVRALHRTCLTHQSESEAADRDGLIARVFLDYILTDGTRVSREYPMPRTLELSDTLVRQYEDIVNDPAYKVLRSLPQNYTAADIEDCTIYNHRHETEVLLTRQEAYDFLKTCLEPDLRDSSMEDHHWIEEPTLNVIVVEPGMEKAEEYVPDRYTAIEVRIEFSRNLSENANYANRYCYFSIPNDATRVLAYAAERGIEPWIEGQGS